MALKVKARHRDPARLAQHLMRDNYVECPCGNIALSLQTDRDVELCAYHYMLRCDRCGRWADFQVAEEVFQDAHDVETVVATALARLVEGFLEARQGREFMRHPTPYIRTVPTFEKRPEPALERERADCWSLI